LVVIAGIWGVDPTDNGHTTTPQTATTAHGVKTGCSWDRNGEQGEIMMMRGRQGKKGMRPHLPLLIGWIMGANSDEG